MFPDHERYGILWMNRRALATALDMDGAFNDVSFSLQRGAAPRDVIDAVDVVLARYGGSGRLRARRPVQPPLHHRGTAPARARWPPSFPLIFLGVAAFLLNVVVTRLIALEREQIGTLKAFGYRTSTIAVHYLKLVLAIVGDRARRRNRRRAVVRARHGRHLPGVLQLSLPGAASRPGGVRAGHRGDAGGRARRHCHCRAACRLAAAGRRDAARAAARVPRDHSRASRVATAARRALAHDPARTSRAGRCAPGSPCSASPPRSAS